MASLTDEEIREEEKFLEGLPRINWGAFFMPAIWGPAHGIWVAILYYPVWLLADNLFYAAFATPSPLFITLAIITGVVLAAITVAFAIVSQPFAAHRAESLGVDRETYLRRERWWTIGCIIAGIIMIALATGYNLSIRPTLPVA